MNNVSFHDILLKNFPYDATPSQQRVLQQLSDYLFENQNEIFLLKGYAGTGKTTLISTFVNNLWKVKKYFTLLAPTGRAAKVMSTYAKQPAFTMHKHLYYPGSDANGKLSFTLRKNKQQNTVFIVDESSMISGENKSDSLFESSSLLSDLIQYVFSNKGNKLILVGDTAQLPPVGMSVSPALDSDYVSSHFDFPVVAVELTDVVRQELDSGILFNATKIRLELQSDFIDEIRFNTLGFNDFIRLDNGYDIQDAIEDAYASQDFEQTAIIVRSNKRANLYNQQIRSRVLFRENELDAGDYLMVVKNNYFWLDKQSVAGFIANGDIIEVLQIYKFIELYGFRFAEVKVRLVDYPDEKPFETVIMLDTLALDAPALSYQSVNKLYHAVNEDYMHLKSKWARYKEVKNNKYFNALQVKFSYALTCHKAQGGQWKNVFIEQPYQLDIQDREQMRWLYTAFTRAQEKLYLIGFTDTLFIS